jgi:hypothetical protein
MVATHVSVDQVDNCNARKSIHSLCTEISHFKTRLEFQPKSNEKGAQDENIEAEKENKTVHIADHQHMAVVTNYTGNNASEATHGIRKACVSFRAKLLEPK